MTRRRAGLTTVLAFSLLTLGCPPEPPPERPPPDDDGPSVPIPELPPAPPEREVAEPGAAAPGDGEAVGLLGQATDPVCGMALQLTGEAPSATHRDVVYRFCSEACRARFLEAPARWTEDGE